MNQLRKLIFSFVVSSLFIFLSVSSSAFALDMNTVIEVKQGHQLKTRHILAFFAYLQTEGEMGDDPTEIEINTATNIAKQTFAQTPGLFVKRMDEILGASPSKDTSKPLTNNPSQSLQQEAKRLYPQYQFRFESNDINTLFDVVNGKHFSSYKSETRRSGKFSMTSALREDIHFCNNGRLFIINHSKMAGGGEKALYNSGDSGGEVTVNAQWGLAQLTNNALVLLLKMGENPVTVTHILSDRVNIQMDNKIFHVLEGAGNNAQICS